MSVGVTISGLAEVERKLSSLPHKMQRSINDKAMGKANKVTVHALRQELSSGSVRDTLKTLVVPNRTARDKAETEKGQLSVAANLSAKELKRSIGVRKMPRGRMRDRYKVFSVVGPRSGFKVTNVRSSKRIPYAATTVAGMIERGTVKSVPNAYTRRVIPQVVSPYQKAMRETALELIAQNALRNWGKT